jgi:hypothetical protein
MPAHEIDLNICFPFPVDSSPGGELSEWESAFNRASQIIYHATSEQLKLGVLTVFIDEESNDETDVLIDEQETGESVTGTFIKLFREERNFPTVIVHEFGHYEFGLGDEYRKYMWLGGEWKLTHGPCTDAAEDQSCIMQFAEDPDVVEFCHPTPDLPGEHQPGNQQHQYSGGKSCWESITARFPWFDVPAPKRPFGSEPDISNHTDVFWNVATGGSGYAIVVESTAQFDGAEFAEAQVNGLRFWIDLLGVERQGLALINSAGESLFDMRLLDDENAIGQAHAAVSQLAFHGETSVTASLEQILAQFDGANRFGNRSASWISADQLVTPPGQSDATPLRRERIRVNSIGLGARDPFFVLSENTRGEIRQVRGSENAEDFKFRIQNAMIETCLEAQPGYQQVGSRLIRFPMKQMDAEHPAPEVAPEHHQALLDKVLVEPGTRAIYFAISLSSSAPIDIDVVDPSAKRLAVGADHAVFVTRPFCKLVKIEEPAAGVWTLQARAPASKVSRFVKTYAYARHPNWIVKLRSWRAGPRGIDFFGSAFADGQLESMEPVVVRIYAPPWMETAPDPSLQQDVILEPAQFFDSRNEILIKNFNHVYRGTLTVDSPGIYTIEARFVNAGRASVIGNADEFNSISPFVRTVFRQIRISE